MTKSTGWSTNYYELPKDAGELNDLITHKNMTWNIANIFKACYRYGDKEGTTKEYDLNKILWFAQKEQEKLKRNDDNNC